MQPTEQAQSETNGIPPVATEAAQETAAVNGEKTVEAEQRATEQAAEAQAPGGDTQMGGTV